jgi:hypothetical protein
MEATPSASATTSSGSQRGRRNEPDSGLESGGSGEPPRQRVRLGDEVSLGVPHCGRVFPTDLSL